MWYVMIESIAPGPGVQGYQEIDRLGALVRTTDLLGNTETTRFQEYLVVNANPARPAWAPALARKRMTAWKPHPSA
jgi:hypothetical protein